MVLCLNVKILLFSFLKNISLKPFTNLQKRDKINDPISSDIAQVLESITTLNFISVYNET